MQQAGAEADREAHDNSAIFLGARLRRQKEVCEEVLARRFGSWIRKAGIQARRRACARGGHLFIDLDDGHLAIWNRPQISALRALTGHECKALACERASRVTEALEAYQRFIKCAPPQYALYIERVRERIRELER